MSRRSPKDGKTGSPEERFKSQEPRAKKSGVESSKSEEQKSEIEHLQRESFGPKSEIKTTQTIKPRPQPMEVHHHPRLDHNPKPWKEYILEGLMIFLAVTMGFFAESLREHITDNSREKEFAEALYNELKVDSTTAATKYELRLEREKTMDYLSHYFKDSSLTALPRHFYPAYTNLYIVNIYTFEPKDGILNQLKNSGSLRYFKSIELQKLLGNLSVSINNIRYRNDQEYQFFASPLKAFLLQHYDFNWLDKLRQSFPPTNSILNIIKPYLHSKRTIDGSILNAASINRTEAANMVMFYKQMLLSSRTLQLHDYIEINHKILEELRKTYELENE